MTEVEEASKTENGSTRRPMAAAPVELQGRREAFLAFNI